MHIQPSCLRIVTAWIVGAAMLLHIRVACGTEPTRPLPPFAKVKQAVDRHFASLPEYQPDDILARSRVEPVFDQLQSLGWTVADREAILKRVPPDDIFLVRQLQTPSGRAFMRQVKIYPEAYDRLDRLARLPYGENTIRALVRGPDGYKMIEYMTTAPGGFNLGKMLSEAPDGKDFDKPTGRIYTAAQLVAALRVSYEAGKKPRPESSPTRSTAK